MSIRRRFAVLAVLAAVPSVHGGMYKWVDEKGIVHYTNVPSGASGKKVEKVRGESVSAYGPPPSALPVEKAGAPAEEPSALVVEMYMTSWNPACLEARQALRMRGFAVREYDIEKDPAAFERAKGLGFTGAVPLLVIAGRSRTGYSREWVDEQLSRR